MSGYSICGKLRKDDVLKSVPLVITSSAGTDEIFEYHKKAQDTRGGLSPETLPGRCPHRGARALRAARRSSRADEVRAKTSSFARTSS